MSESLETFLANVMQNHESLETEKQSKKKSRNRTLVNISGEESAAKKTTRSKAGQKRTRSSKPESPAKASSEKWKVISNIIF